MLPSQPRDGIQRSPPSRPPYRNRTAHQVVYPTLHHLLAVARERCLAWERLEAGRLAWLRVVRSSPCLHRDTDEDLVSDGDDLWAMLLDAKLRPFLE